MKWIVDAVLWAIVAVGLIAGAARGFIKTVAKPVRLMLALMAAFGLAGVVSAKIFEPLLYAPVAKQLSEFMQAHCGDITAASASEQVPTVLRLAAGLFNINIDAVAGEAGAAGVLDAITDALTQPLVHVVSMIVSFLVVLLAANLVLMLVFAILNSLFSDGALGVLNRVLGCLVSGAFGVLIAWAAVSLFTFVIGLPALSGVQWAANFEGGFFYTFLRRFSPVDFILSF